MPEQELPRYASDDFATAAGECDIVMKGGITSGIVYPYAILEIAKANRFRSIGGSSAGAIAAAFTAAAEYARTVRGDPAGYRIRVVVPPIGGTQRIARLDDLERHVGVWHLAATGPVPRIVYEHLRDTVGINPPPGYADEVTGPARLEPTNDGPSRPDLRADLSELDRRVRAQRRSQQAAVGKDKAYRVHRSAGGCAAHVAADAVVSRVRSGRLAHPALVGRDMLRGDVLLGDRVASASVFDRLRDGCPAPVVLLLPHQDEAERFTIACVVCRQPLCLLARTFRQRARRP